MNPLTSLLLTALYVGVLLQCVQCIPVAQSQPSNPYGHHDVGRVKIQVYRGPSIGKDYKKFAPWGYYATQPSDETLHYAVRGAPRGYRKGSDLAVGKGTDPRVHSNSDATQPHDLKKRSYGAYGYGYGGYGARGAPRRYRRGSGLSVGKDDKFGATQPHDLKKKSYGAYGYGYGYGHGYGYGRR
ncbi:shematrin-like protein 1 [Oscarella lobularis]|uniref:shematrin-like protein 1 n=1 Tax=Oscarella lobularis TaxID=121494 RepID=UPI0033139BB1